LTARHPKFQAQANEWGSAHGKKIGRGAFNNFFAIMGNFVCNFVLFHSATNMLI